MAGVRRFSPPGLPAPLVALAVAVVVVQMPRSISRESPCWAQFPQACHIWAGRRFRRTSLCRVRDRRGRSGAGEFHERDGDRAELRLAESL